MGPYCINVNLLFQCYILMSRTLFLYQGNFLFPYKQVLKSHYFCGILSCSGEIRKFSSLQSTICTVGYVINWYNFLVKYVYLETFQFNMFSTKRKIIEGKMSFILKWPHLQQTHKTDVTAMLLLSGNWSSGVRSPNISYCHLF